MMRRNSTGVDAACGISFYYHTRIGCRKIMSMMIERHPIKTLIFFLHIRQSGSKLLQ